MKVAILFLAAALGSANPVQTANSIQTRDGQNSCRCDWYFAVKIPSQDHFCPTNYELMSHPELGAACHQKGCYESHYSRECGDGFRNEELITAVKQADTCDCSWDFEYFPGIQERGCKAGYSDNSTYAFWSECVQKGCEKQRYEAECSTSAPEEKQEKQTSSCDCGRTFHYFPYFYFWGCEDGYEDISENGGYPNCVQRGCEEQDYNAQCYAGWRAAKRTTNAPALKKYPVHGQ
ncbi:hypothetical protein IF1G_04206 [Cordyceps javanica]|uniref:Uncharacterized protein n=1 Tax=Cordyceps javanica TaxID=43265 RepID=A0A545V5I2_9HYPO|nr:hypothetical protein IF1G_04206 [Cordyceps javanica]TQW08222.1 hypothetical protein IF2G_04098 [Cordyceps javanica]